MKIAIVDIETAGFGDAVDTNNDLIVEIAVVVLDTQSGVAENVFHSLIKEEGLKECHKNSWGFRNSDLKFSDVMKAPPLDSVHYDLQKIFDSYPVTAYNTRFDFGHLRKRGFRIVELPCMMIAMQKHLSRSKWPKFQESWDIIMNEPYVEKHRSVDDALHEARFCFEIIRRKILKV